jgi:ABC-type branched-subunit amino acid transport system substrate-binding protein
VDGTRSALIIATDQHTDPGLRRLRAPASDAWALAAVLRDPGIGGFEVRTLLNEPAHVVNLAVEEFFADRRPGDLLLVHFSGHGVKDEDGELYFAASNTVLGRLGATAVAAEFVSRRMSRSRSRRVVLLLDCCYAGAFERGLVARAGTEVGIEQQFGGRGRAVITASSAMEYAFEAGELTDAREVPPSVFTSALVQGLETGEADRDQDGLVGLDELYDYVYDQVRAATPNQTPGKWTFGVEGGLYIARRSRPVTTPAPLPPELRHAIESPLAGVRAGAVQELAGVLRGSHAGMALAARLALEQLTEDDSRAVAAAAAAVLGAPARVPPRLARPELVLSDAVINLGRFPQHGLSPEQRVRISNAGGGDLNAQVAASASWLRLRQAGDELVVAVDTSAAGEYEGAVTVDSDGGTATVRVHAQVDPAPPPAPEAAAPTHPEPVPGTPDAAWPEPELLPEPEPVPDVAAAVAGPVPGVDGAAAADVPEPEPVADVAGAVAPPGDGEQRATPPPRDDHPRVATSGLGPDEQTPQAPRPSRAIRRRPVIIAATAIGIAVIGLVIAITTNSGTPHRSARPPASRPAVSGPLTGGNGSNTVDIYSSLPLRGASSAQTGPLVNGIKLALDQAGGKAGQWTVNYQSLDDSTAAAGKWDPGQTAANARKVASDPKAVYYIGEFNAGASEVSIPILNEGGIPQVSPANTYVGLTTSLPGSAPGEPQKHYPTGKRTYLRIIPIDSIQAAADLIAMKDAGCTKVAIANDKEAYGAGLATLLELEKGYYGVTIVSNTGIDPTAPNFRSYASTIQGQGADCFFFAGIVSNGAVQVTKDVHSAIPTAKIFGSDGVCTDSYTSAANGGVPATIDPLIECTVATQDLDAYPGGKLFLAAYQAKYGVSSPDPYAIYGYEVMKLGLDTIKGLGAQGDSKSAVLKALFATTARQSVLGTYGFNANGDTTLKSYGLYKVASNGEPVFYKTVTPTKAVQ